MNRKLFNLKNIAMVAVFSLVAFFGFNSFKSANVDPKTNKVSALQWFRYTGTTVAGQTNPDNYVLSTTKPQDCEGEGLLCAIHAETQAGNPSKPDLSTISEGDSTFRDLPEQ